MGSRILYRLLDNVFVIGITIFALLQGELTIFYLLYLFFWEEVIRQICLFVIGRRVDKTYSLANYLKSMGILLIYLIFIVVFFAFVIDIKDTERVMLNAKILAFRHPYFLASLGVFALQFVVFLLMNREKIDFKSIIGSSFLLSLIVLHISVVLGAILSFFVVDKYPDIFTKENLLGSILVALPFLITRAIFNPKLIFKEDETADKYRIE